MLDFLTDMDSTYCTFGEKKSVLLDAGFMIGYKHIPK